VEVADFMVYNKSDVEGTIVKSMGGEFVIEFESDLALPSKYFEIKFGTGTLLPFTYPV